MPELRGCAQHQRRGAAAQRYDGDALPGDIVEQQLQPVAELGLVECARHLGHQPQLPPLEKRRDHDLQGQRHQGLQQLDLPPGRVRHVGLHQTGRQADLRHQRSGHRAGAGRELQCAAARRSGYRREHGRRGVERLYRGTRHHHRDRRGDQHDDPVGCEGSRHRPDPRQRCDALAPDGARPDLHP